MGSKEVRKACYQRYVDKREAQWELDKTCVYNGCKEKAAFIKDRFGVERYIKKCERHRSGVNERLRLWFKNNGGSARYYKPRQKKQQPVE